MSCGILKISRLFPKPRQYVRKELSAESGSPDYFGLNVDKEVSPKISTCHRIGNKTPSRNRPIIVKLSSQDDRNKCLRNTPKLKGTNIVINEDVSKATQEIRRTKMPELMEKR